jgi:hypothetical protein
MATKTENFDGVSRTRPARVSWTDGASRSYTFDIVFDGCTLDDVLSLAMRSIVIDEQRAMRAANVADAPTDGAKITLHANTYGRGARVRDPMARAGVALVKLSDADRDTLMARHGYTKQ